MSIQELIPIVARQRDLDPNEVKRWVNSWEGGNRASTVYDHLQRMLGVRTDELNSTPLRDLLRTLAEGTSM